MQPGAVSENRLILYEETYVGVNLRGYVLDYNREILMAYVM